MIAAAMILLNNDLTSNVVAIEMGRWVYPCSAIMFFLLFGFADEARRCYSAAFWRIAKVFGVLPKSKKGDKAGYVFL